MSKDQLIEKLAPCPEFALVDRKIPAEHSQSIVLDRLISASSEVNSGQAHVKSLDWNLG